MNTVFCSTPTNSTASSSVGPSKGKAKGKRPCSTPSESALIDHLASSRMQYDRMQAAISSLIGSQTNSVPKAYGSILASFAADVHPQLMSEFMKESWDLVMRYKDKGDRLREAERNTPPVPAAPVTVVPVTVRPVHATTIPQGQQQQCGFYPAPQQGFYPPQQGQPETGIYPAPQGGVYPQHQGQQQPQPRQQYPQTQELPRFTAFTATPEPLAGKPLAAPVEKSCSNVTSLSGFLDELREDEDTQ